MYFYYSVCRFAYQYEKIVIDCFHVVRYCTDAMENVRRGLQKALPDAQRKFLKRSRKMLLAHRDRLTE